MEHTKFNKALRNAPNAPKKGDALLTCAWTGELSDSCCKAGHLQIIGSSETGQSNQPLLSWKSKKYYIFLCACARLFACARERGLGICACVLVLLHIRHASRMRHTVTPFVAPPHFLTLTRRFSKNVTEHKMCVFIFSESFVWNTSRSKKNLARYCHKCENVCMYSTCHFCRILIKLEFS
jgi:hypothetical protein